MARLFLVWCLILVMKAHLILAEGSYMARKLGKHNIDNIEVYASSPSPSPSEAFKNEESGAAEQEQVLEQHHHHYDHHSSIDKSVCGGGVIIGVLVIIFLAAVFGYIRVTRRKSVVPVGSPAESPVRGERIVSAGGKQSIGQYTNMT
ncbi:hypothetical protein CASFOL_015648 [Castilleja foliolosa]|uniref:Uncharacterized protein n=1 Tax=Castilleja foliolosa TaxID=1961234 RepID=A0ABD3DE97_9LAMI